MAARLVTTPKLVQALKSGVTTPVQVLKDCFLRAGALDGSLNALTVTAPAADLLQHAGAAGHTVTAANASPVCGLPVAVKDCIHVKGLPTSNGIRSLDPTHSSGSKRESDAPVVAALRSAGALICSKTTLPEGSLDVQTFSDAYGITSSPWHPSLTPGGSSGGSAVAVATGMAHLALGTDLAGSLRIPAAFTGVAALRPTGGRYPILHTGFEPAIPKAGVAVESGIVMGPMGRDVEALQGFMHAACGEPGGALLEEEEEEEDKEVATLRVGVSTALPGIRTEPVVSQNMKSLVVDQLAAGEVDVHSVEPWDAGAVSGLARAHAVFCSTYLMPGGKAPSEEALQKSLAARELGKEALQALFEDVDVWILPVCPTLQYPHNLDHASMTVDGKPVSYWPATIGYVVPLTVVGHPVVAMPVGMTQVTAADGVPVPVPFGVQVVGKHGDDMNLLRICKRIQQLLPRLPPPPVLDGLLGNAE